MIEGYEKMAARLLDEVERQADIFRECDDELSAVPNMHRATTDAAKALAAAIVSPLIRFQNANTDSGRGTSMFAYTVYYFALEYITNILDACSGSKNEWYPAETKLMAKFNSTLEPIKTIISKPI